MTKIRTTKLDPIITVKDVEASSKWYQSIFNWKSMHGGKEFDILVSDNDEVILCLHEWGKHGHPTMTNPNITPGNGLILYFRTENMNAIRKNVERIGGSVEEECSFKFKLRENGIFTQRS